MVTVVVDDRVAVVYFAVQNVVDVPCNDGCEGHSSPVLTQPADAEGMCDETGIHAEEEAVCQPCQAGDENEEMWIRDSSGEKVGDGEDGSGDE